VVNDDNVEGNNGDDGDKNSWVAKKRRKWVTKRRRKIKCTVKRLGMMASDDTNEYKPEEAQNGDIDKHIMGHRRRFQQHKSNRARRSQKWRK
jgi:UDP-2,3-diacylglucosamine pyrophosphatase LpxH